MEDLQNRYWPSVDDLMTWMDTHPDAMIFLGLLFGVGFIVLFVGWWVGVMYVPPHARQTLTPLPQDPIQPDLERGVHAVRESVHQVGSHVHEPADRILVSGPRVDDRAAQARPAPAALAPIHASESQEQMAPAQPLPLQDPRPVSPASSFLDGATNPNLESSASPVLDSRTKDIPAPSHTGLVEQQPAVEILESPHLQEPTLGDLEFGHDSHFAQQDLLQEQALTVQQDDAESQWTKDDLGELSQMIQQATFEEQDATSPGADFLAEPSPAEPQLSRSPEFEAPSPELEAPSPGSRTSQTHGAQPHEERAGFMPNHDHEPLVADSIPPEAEEEALLPQSRPWRLSDINDLKALDARLARAHALRDTPTGVTVARQDLSQMPDFAQEKHEPVTEVAEMIAPEPLFPTREVRPISGLGHKVADQTTPPLSPAIPAIPATPEIPATPAIPATPKSLAKDQEAEPLSDTTVPMEEDALLPDSGAPEELSRFADFQLKLDVSAQDLAEVGLPLQSEALVAESALPVVPPIVSLSDLNAEQLLLVARYCQWRGDLEGVREAIAPILERDDARLRRQALALLEGR